jgi:hypothetical protein
MTLLDELGADLAARGVAYAVIGATALAARGIARSTYDVDVLVVDRRVLDDGWWSAWRDRERHVEVRRGDADDPLAGVVRVVAAHARPVDVIVGRHAWQARALERADRPEEGAPVVTAVDLVLLKLYAGGTQDTWDVRALLALPDGQSLAEQVEHELETMPAAMRQLWRQVITAGR